MENLNAQPTFKKYSPIIVDTSKRSLEISAADVAVALGAESQSETVSASGRLPMRYAFRSELYHRNKISVSSQDWAILERIAAQLSKPGVRVRPSAALVGGVLIRLAIASVIEADSPADGLPNQVGSDLKSRLTASIE